MLKKHKPLDQMANALNSLKEFLWPLVERIFGVIMFLIVDNSLDGILRSFSVAEDVINAINSKMGLFTLILIVLLILGYGLDVYLLIQSKNRIEENADNAFLDFHSDLVQHSLKLRNSNAANTHFHTHASFYDRIELDSAKMLDDICAFLTEQCFPKDKNHVDEQGKPKIIEACVKMIETESLRAMVQTGNINECKVFTLCRGGPNKEGRKSIMTRQLDGDWDRDYDSVDLISDFYTMLRANQHEETCNGENACKFASRDMVLYRNRIDRFNAYCQKYPDKGIQPYRPYRTTSQDWWENYQSTVCVPIRVKIKDLDESWKQLISREHWTGDYLVLGFLCTDHKYPISKRMLNTLIKYTSSFANSFAGFFYEVSVKDLKIEPSTLKDSARGNENPQGPDILITKGDRMDTKLINRIVRLTRHSPETAQKQLGHKLAEFANVAPDRMEPGDPFYKFMDEKLNPQHQYIQ